MYIYMSLYRVHQPQAAQYSRALPDTHMVHLKTHLEFCSHFSLLQLDTEVQTMSKQFSSNLLSIQCNSQTIFGRPARAVWLTRIPRSVFDPRGFQVLRRRILNLCQGATKAATTPNKLLKPAASWRSENTMPRVFAKTSGCRMLWSRVHTI